VPPSGQPLWVRNAGNRVNLCDCFRLWSAESRRSAFGQHPPEADLLLTAAKNRGERPDGNLNCREGVIRETA
jgi:hypothetical protein